MPGRSNRSPKGRITPWFAALALLFLVRAEAPAQAAVSEYQVKAVFLFNFTQFVGWPPQAFAEAQSPLVIGILGDDPFGSYLEDAVRGEKVNHRPLVIRHYRRVTEIKACQILFISRSEHNRLAGILASLNGRDILTVSDANEFAQLGGMIRFVTEKEEIHFRVNLEAVKATHLTISSKLLRFAEIVSPRKDPL